MFLLGVPSLGVPAIEDALEFVEDRLEFGPERPFKVVELWSRESWSRRAAGREVETAPCLTLWEFGVREALT